MTLRQWRNEYESERKALGTSIEAYTHQNKRNATHRNPLNKLNKNYFYAPKGQASLLMPHPREMPSGSSANRSTLESGPNHCRKNSIRSNASETYRQTLSWYCVAVYSSCDTPIPLG